MLKDGDHSIDCRKKTFLIIRPSHSPSTKPHQAGPCAENTFVFPCWERGTGTAAAACEELNARIVAEPISRPPSQGADANLAFRLLLFLLTVPRNRGWLAPAWLLLVKKTKK